MIRLLAPALLAMATGLAACSSAATGDRTAEVAAAAVLPGREMAENLCSGCHAIGRTGISPHPDALPFRRIAMNYPVRDLEEAFAEGIFVGHPDMPPFVFSPEDIDALLTYIQSIQDPA
jgi:mono/diheme cytochrome c family protein